MFRKALISLVAVATIGTGIVSMTSTADAHRRHHHHRSHISLGFAPFFAFPGYGYGYPAFYDGYDDYQDCGYRRIKVKKWNKAHTHRIIVYKKRWVCY